MGHSADSIRMCDTTELIVEGAKTPRLRRCRYAVSEKHTSWGLPCVSLQIPNTYTCSLSDAGVRTVFSQFLFLMHLHGGA